MKFRFILTGLSALVVAATAGSAQDAWKEFTWKEGKCSLLLPGKPTEKKNSLQLVVGPAIYMVHFADTPGMAKADAKLIQQVFDQTRDELVKSLKGKLLADKAVKVENSPGRELQIEAAPFGIYRTRLLQVGDRYYQMILMGSKEVIASKEAEKFFGSFKPTK